MKAVTLLAQVKQAARAGALAATVSFAAFLALDTVAYAQFENVAGSRDPNQKMFVDADEVVYDDVRSTASAVGNVKLYYGDAVLEADRVVYDQTTGKVSAFGNVRLYDQGNVYQSDHMVLTEDFSDGFVQSLLVEGADRTRFAAARATRTEGRIVVFEKGVYTACEPCRENPAKPPFWQIKAARIIHDQGTNTVYYEDARFEFFGKPIMWLPYFQHADGTVKRKSGFLTPRYMNSTEYGFGARIPYFWNVRPNIDVTFAPALLTKQGVMPDVEFRHRTTNGAYSIRAAGIYQQDPGVFNKQGDFPGQDDDFRGAITTRGDFRINDFWTWGWNANVVSDKWVLEDYDMWGASWTEAISTAHLTGMGDRNYFELRGYYFYGLSSDDVQDQLPVAGVWDYNYIHDKPVVGGELAFNVNLTTTYRKETDFEPLSGNVVGSDGDNLTCDDFELDKCIVPGVAGSYTRLSVDTSWKREFIDPIGQVWTPFAFARGDVMFLNADNSDTLADFINTDDEFVTRGMVGAGLEYRYPFVAHNSMGTHIFEPMAQVIIRPNETEIGNIPNEDAQSLFFDTSTLFSWDKFSGFDRIEGGGRANVGAQYTLHFNSGGFANLMFGQSYQLYGENSFAEDDLLKTGEGTGLDKDRSDYVASGYVQFTKEISFASRFRFDADTFDERAIELETKVRKGPVLAGLTYGRYEEQPQFGIERAEGVVGSARVQLTDEVYVLGGARYNIETNDLDRIQVGAGYLDECFGLGVNYSVDFHENGNDDPVHKVFLRMSLRTLGEAGTSVNVSNMISDDETTP